ncbi:MAG TPA: maleylpyruvate isomerase N-terminal domain-containing protein [Streptosporangiaceae bacterium]|nr:maleylpyruvate isomerase N-terminal domain-containing protein [Streptosporangiaceae bacterium]
MYGLWGQSMTEWTPGAALSAYHAGVVIICELSAQFTPEAWAGPTPCPEWRAVDLAGHLRCVADNYHEYLDDAPVSLLARLMSASAGPPSLARKLARQNAAELAALPDATGPEHIAAFAASARAYALRVVDVWDMPHHHYRDTLVTVGGFVGAACAEWHLHAWDLARSLGKDYRPATCEVLVAGWQAGMPHLPLEVPVAVGTCAAAARPGPATETVGAGHGLAESDSWRVLLRASGRV